MFLSIRELKYSKGKFTMIATVIFFITVLISMLSGLTAGLAIQNISGVLSLPKNNIISNIQTTNSEKSLTDSVFTDNDYNTIKANHTSIIPIGIMQYSLQNAKNKTGVSFYGSDKLKNSPSKNGEIVLSEKIANQLHIKENDKLKNSNYNFTVSRIVNNDYYAHTPIAWITLNDWQKLNNRISANQAYATIINSDTSYNNGNMKTYSKLSVLPFVGAFRSEIGSLGLMIGMLFAISSLIVASFFIIWTNQRKYEFSVLKALGSDNKSLIKDNIFQTIFILLTGTVLALITTEIFSLLLKNVEIPFINNVYTLFVPFVVVIITGMVGSLVSLIPIIKSNPLESLGGGQ